VLVAEALGVDDASEEEGVELDVGCTDGPSELEGSDGATEFPELDTSDVDPIELDSAEVLEADDEDGNSLSLTTKIQGSPTTAVTSSTAR
jgi:hypothetical protein